MIGGAKSLKKNERACMFIWVMRVSIFALKKIVLEQRYLEMIAPLGYLIHHYSSLSNDLQNISYISTLGKACFSFSCFFLSFLSRESQFVKKNSTDTDAR